MHLNRRAYKSLVCLFGIVIGLPTPSAYGTAGTEIYSYDARGRLAQVTYPGGASIVYTYDAAGNRTASGKPVSTGGGTFSYLSGSHSSAGSTGDIVTASIKNTGSAALTAISYSCNGSFHTYGTNTTTLAVGASASYQCQAAASGGYTVVMTFTSTTASTSPFSTPSF